MSTYYRSLQPILASELFDGRLLSFGIHEDVNEDTDHGQRCLTDGSNYFWAYVAENGEVAGFARFGLNDPSTIIDAISATFEVDIVDEHEPQYFGYESQEEWDEALEKEEREEEEQFQEDVLNYLHAKPNGLVPETLGMEMAEAIRRKVEETPSLLALENRADLRDLISAVHNIDQAYGVRLTGNFPHQKIEIIRVARRH